MILKNLYEILKQNEYPGRGIVIGKTADGEHAAIAYFIMGRSENSRNRIFSAVGDDLETKAFDDSKLVDPSLIIYSPVRVDGKKTIVTNGDQTDTIYEFLKNGKTFRKSLQIREFEPDAPNFTPRISGIVDVTGEVLKYKLSILKSAEGNGNSCQRFFYEYSSPINGMGHFIHTYKGNGEPIPSFEGEPVSVNINDDINTFADNIWNSLNSDNKVSLFVRFIKISDGTQNSIIINKNK
ncbi:MAG: IMP cyclohydrolase [Clostridia bacterium]